MLLTRPILASVSMFAVVALLVGCGGGSSSSSSSAPVVPGRAALIKEADAICAATDEVTTTLQSEFKKASNPAAPNYESKLAELLVRIVVIGRTEAEELAVLKPPAGEAATFERWLAVGQEGLGDFEAAARALKKDGRSPKFTTLYEEGQSRLAQANEIATNYGFEVCGGQRI